MEQPVDHELTRVSARRDQQRSRHSRALAQLMEERRDLYGVTPLADLVADSLRWTA